MAELVTVAVHYDLSEALCDCAFLDANGVNVILFDRYLSELSAFHLMAIGGLRLMVPEPERADAEALLASKDEYTGDGTVETCPQCGSGSMLRGRSMAVLVICGLLWSAFPILVFVLLLRLALGLPLVIFANQRQCKKCGHQWRAA